MAWAETLGKVVVNIGMVFDQSEADKAEKKVLTKTANMVKKMQKLALNGVASGMAQIFGGEAGMMLTALSGGGFTGLATAVSAIAIDKAVKSVVGKYKSTDYFENIDPIVQKDIESLKSIKKELTASDRDNMIILDLAKVLNTLPETLAKQINISQRYEGFDALKGDTSTEKFFNFMAGISGLTPTEQIKRAKMYGITASNIPALKEGLGDVKSTMSGQMSSIELANYAKVLVKYLDEEQSFQSYISKKTIEAKSQLEIDKLFGEKGAYTIRDKSKKGKFDKGMRRGLESQTTDEAFYRTMSDMGEDISDIANIVRQNVSKDKYKLPNPTSSQDKKDKYRYIYD